MRYRQLPLVVEVAVLLLALACSQRQSSEEVIFSNPLNAIESVITKNGVTLDRTISRDGNGSIRIETNQPTTIRIAEVSPEAAENAVLIYRASLRTEELSGQAYLEMWCSIPGKGEFFSRALHAPLSGSTDWVSQETPFFLDKGQRAQTVKLNVVVTGAGTVWVDNVVLAKAVR